MNTLPREVLKWLQTLQLSYTYRNPKHDFANGYLIAEICYRYFPNDLILSRMGMFVNGATTASKQANWELIARFFKRHEINVHQEIMDAVMHGLPNAAVIFLRNLYLLITKRRIKFVDVNPILRRDPVAPTNFSLTNSPEKLQHFELPTTSQLIKNIPNSEHIVTIDIENTRKKVKTIMDWQDRIFNDLVKYQFEHLSSGGNRKDLSQVLQQAPCWTKKKPSAYNDSESMLSTPTVSPKFNSGTSSVAVALPSTIGNTSNVTPANSFVSGTKRPSVVNQ